MSVTTAVVLAAGEGVRLRPLTRNRPKPMLPAANRPIIEHVLDSLIDAGIQRVVLVVGYRHERVQEHFGPTYRDTELTYVRQEKQLGSGHALECAGEVVESPVLVVNGDQIADAGIVRDVRESYESYADPALAVIEHPRAGSYGAVDLENGRVTNLRERPGGDYRLLNAGVYAVDDAVFDAIDAVERVAGEVSLPSAMAYLVREGRVRAVRSDGLWLDATYPWDLLVLSRKLLAEGRVREPEREPGVHVDDTSHVHPDASLVGPVAIGPDCEVAAGAVVGPNVALGRNVTVGPNASVRETVLDDDARVGDGTTVVDCVTGQDVHLGPEVLVPGGPSDVVLDEELHPDRDLGAVLADRVHAAGGATFEPGALVGPGARIRTGVIAGGRIPEGAEVVR